MDDVILEDVQLVRVVQFSWNLFQDQEDFDRVANTIMDEAVNEVTLEYMAREQEDAASERAAAYVDAPTCEHMLQALERMEVGQEATPANYYVLSKNYYTR